MHVIQRKSAVNCAKNQRKKCPKICEKPGGNPGNGGYFSSLEIFILYILVNDLVGNNVRYSFFHIYVKRTEFYKYYVWYKKGKKVLEQGPECVVIPEAQVDQAHPAHPTSKRSRAGFRMYRMRMYQCTST